MYDLAMKSPRRNRQKPAHPPTLDVARTQALLRENQVLLDNAFVGIFFVRDRRFIRTNRRAETLFGYAPGELIGRSTEVIYPDHATFLALGERAYPIINRGEVFADEVELARRDGSRFWCQMRAQALAPGQPLEGIIWILDDITERKRAEAAIQATLAFRKDLLEAIPAPVFFKDAQGRYEGVNHAFTEFFGRAEADLIGKTVHECWPRENADRFYAEDQALFQTPGVQIYEAQIRHPRGDLRSVVFHKATLHHPDGRLRGLIGFILDVTERKAAEAALRASLADVQRHNARMITLNRTNDLLLSCMTLEEAYMVIGRGAGRLFAGYHGALAVPDETSESKSRVVATWGDLTAVPATFPLDHCRALRSGAIYEVPDPAGGARCTHLREPPPAHLCVPLTVHGETLGLLHLGAGELLTEERFADLRTLAIAFSEAIKLALSNIRLQEALREQAIRDPLTSLFNRRYLDETLPRELDRARRLREPLAVAMLDLDHFKRFNDTFGHEAGDAVLRALGTLLGRTLRSSDLACRYGGEEFTLILPGSSLSDARARLDGLRESVTQLRVPYQGADLPPITVSIGVTAARAQETDAAAVLARADAALYQAKDGGRNQVITGNAD